MNLFDACGDDRGYRSVRWSSPILTAEDAMNELLASLPSLGGSYPTLLASRSKPPRAQGDGVFNGSFPKRVVCRSDKGASVRSRKPSVRAVVAAKNAERQPVGEAATARTFRSPVSGSHSKTV